MIHQFKVKNFLSIREEQMLDFAASKYDKTYEEYTVVDKNKIRLSKLGVIYGANASGKSNILFALDWLLKFIIVNENDKLDLKKYGFKYQPFLLDNDSRNQETSMFLSFFSLDIRYEYKIVFNKDRIIEEQLCFYPKNRKKNIYHRSWNSTKMYSNISFGSSCHFSAMQKSRISLSCRHKKTVLSAYLDTNVEKNDILDDVIKYIKYAGAPLITSLSDLEKFANSAIKYDSDCYKFICNILKQADFNISNIRLTEVETDNDSIEAEPFKDSLFFSHETPFHKEDFPVEFESLGTKRMYGLASVLFLLVKGNVILTIDELESSLHYDLLSYFIKVFLTNSESGQLIFSTHSLMLLDEPFIRRDSIFFCEKNIGGATIFYNAKEFGLNNNVSILNAYKAGKLGAKPQLGSILIEK